MKNADHYQQAEQLFQAALELKPEERTAFLAEACADDCNLLDEVNALLYARQAGAGFDDSSDPTKHLSLAPTQRRSPNPSLHSSDDGQREGRFIAGAMLAGRYRIVGLLGKGGMGEVYKAEDLKLNQTVALKFLPESIALDGGMLARFHNEVRIARQVAHPNVCRVYDIGEVEGLHFLSMEFIDGEDLSSLLRRIGRLPGDKAVEIARQLCAGLAAAHEAGVLHRDLKPANVMIDGRGKARITDFGLAVVSEELRGEEVMAGTPAYMALEQLTGKAATQRSDIYSLGLVLYELFTGKRVFEAKSINELIALHEKSAPPTPSSHVKDIDPLVERVILRCLAKDPKARPASAVQVALALPGGDPLQAALAMGETPSPEMVAAAGAKTGLRPKVAVACLIAVIIGLIVTVHLRSKVRLIDMTPFENPPEVLSRKAREIIAQLGYPERPTNTAHGFDHDRKYLDYVRRQVPAGERWQRLGQSRPAAIFFWHRESSQQLLPTRWPGQELGGGSDVARVKENDPPQTTGMVSVRLDMQGRLIRFSAVPPQFDEAPSRPPHPDKADWAGLFSTAGIDAARLTPTEAQWTPPSAFDARAAWVGTFPEQPDLAMRVEAAAWHDKPVYFQVIGPWTTPDRETAVGPAARYILWLFIILLLAIVFLGGMLAWRNLRQGRGDRKGAFRLAVFTFLSIFFAGLVGSFVPTVIPQELGIRGAFLSAGLIWVIYVAIEPYVRRRWPVTLISWSRALAGSFRDPLVGRDVLFGILVGTLSVLTWALSQSVSPSLGTFPTSSDTLLIDLSGTRLAVSTFVFQVIGSATGAFLILFVLFLLRLLTRRDWRAVSLFTLIIPVGPLFTGDWLSAIQNGLVFGLFAVVLTRYGLVTLASAIAVANLLNNFPVTLNFSVWYAGTGLLALLAILALAAFAFYMSLGGQKVFEGKLLDE